MLFPKADTLLVGKDEEHGFQVTKIQKPYFSSVPTCYVDEDLNISKHRSFSKRKKISLTFQSELQIDLKSK